MPRIARKESKSGVYHIMFRGNELRDIFLDDEDISRSEMTRDLFREYISWMLFERGLSPVTVNVRIRTLRAFL